MVLLSHRSGLFTYHFTARKIKLLASSRFDGLCLKMLKTKRRLAAADFYDLAFARHHAQAVLHIPRAAKLKAGFSLCRLGYRYFAAPIVR